MEHGGVWLLYNCPNGCESDVARLGELTARSIGQAKPVALAPYPSMPARFAAVSWQYLLPLESLDLDLLQTFIERHACDYNPEGGPFCDGVREHVGGATPPAPSATPQR